MVFALVFGGADGDGKVFPVDEVAAAGVAPVHVAPEGAVGVVLVEEVVPAAVEDGAIGVVAPVGRGMEVIDGTGGVGGGGGESLQGGVEGLAESGISGEG